MPSAIIFDLDGTLLDTLQDLADSANEALAASGFPVHPLDAYRTFVGEGMTVLMERILPDASRDSGTVAALLACYREAYGRRWKSATRPYGGIPALLDALTARGIPMAVLSNKPQGFTELCVHHHLPSWQFAPLLGQRDDVPRKPDPAGAHEIAAALNLPASEIVFAGDTRTDMETAVNAGMIPAGVTWGFRQAAELTASGARHLVHRPAEILALFPG